MKPLPKVLEEALKVVAGDRKDSYGPVENNFQKIAYGFMGVLFDKLKPGAQITPEDVALMMINLKTARESFVHKGDNITDIFGYGLLLAQLTGEAEVEGNDV